MGDGTRFHIPLLGEKMNFSVWRSSVEDLLVQQSIDETLERIRPTTPLWEGKMGGNEEEGDKYYMICHCTRNHIKLLEGDGN